MQYNNRRNNGYSNNNGGGGNIGMMIQRCHKWRMNRKKYLDLARTTIDKIERERLFQMAEHYGRMINDEQGKIDLSRGDSKELESLRKEIATESADAESAPDDNVFPDFISGAAING
ncbi:MAG: hypothetical protein LBH81_01370 [Rickettsiales bacterium]|jgi:hypothetical protein|nr:hypothetical protein [Rickettsiales bacterium]